MGPRAAVHGRGTSRASEGRGVLGLVVSFIWALLIIASAVGAMLGAAWLLRQSREVFHPWYAYPTRFLLFLIAAGLTVPWYLTRLMHFLPVGLQSLRTPTAVWALILPIWAALAAAIEFTAPAASHLWVLPLLAASVPLLVVPLRLTLIVRVDLADRRDRLRAVLAARRIRSLSVHRAAHGPAPDRHAVSGSTPRTSPSSASCSLRRSSPRSPARSAAACAQTAIGASLLLALAISTGLSYVADAYTPDRPLRRVARYVHDVAPGQAWWDVGGNEPGLDLALSTADAAQWRLQQGDAAAPVGASVSPLIPPLGLPFVFRAPAPPAPAPADVVATFASKEGATQFEITIVPKLESLSASIALPAGVEPTQANLSGRREPRSNRWIARFAAIPDLRHRVPRDGSRGAGGTAGGDGGHPDGEPRARRRSAARAGVPAAAAHGMAGPVALDRAAAADHARVGHARGARRRAGRSARWSARHAAGGTARAPAETPPAKPVP